MSKLNPIEEAEFIEKDFRSYLKSTFNFNETNYQKMFINELDKTNLFKGPFIKVNLPFKTDRSLNELIGENEVSSEFRKLNNIKLDQKLYYHQSVALKKISEGKNVVITTGTGSGKTECFLYPIINSLMREKENNTLRQEGIRALFLYPMNALVNDQIDRVRKLLTSYPEIKYAFFTGDTPNSETNIENYREELEKLNETQIPQNELLTREQIRKDIPHLLFTNYSMLEYLMIRPNDYVLFEKEKLNNWRYIVLDEAHTYNGALGIELAMLLRRVTGMARKKPQFILTSATLGKKGKNEDEIISFAENLTSTNFNKEDIIFSERLKLDSNDIKYTISPKDYEEIEENINDINKVINIGNKYCYNNSKDIHKYLYDLLKYDENTYILYDILNSNECSFNDVWNKIKNYNFNNRNELVSLIHLINMARDNFSILYDMKYHYFVRTLSGAFGTLGKDKELRLSPCLEINNKMAFELGNCRYCNATYVLGKITGDSVLHQNRDVDIYENYGENENIRLDYFLIKNAVNLDDIDMEMCTEYEICSKCGKIHNVSEVNFKKCNCGEEYKVRLLKVITDSLNKNNINECPCCKRKSNSGIVRTLNLGKDEATAILGQILFNAIDNRDVKDSKNNGNNSENLLSFSNYKLNNIKNENNSDKKQYLAFSDSRQQASFFAEFFEYNFKRFMRNRLLWDILEDNNHNPINVNRLVIELRNKIEKYKLFKDDDLNSEKEAWISILRELLEVDGSFTGEGVGLFLFKLNLDDIKAKVTDKSIEENFGKYNLNSKSFYDFVSVVFDVIRRTPAINYDKSTLTMEERNKYLEYRSFENYIKLKKGKETKEKNVRSFLPVNDRPNDIVDYTMRVCKCNQREASKILETIFMVIGRNGEIFSKSNKSLDEVYQIDAEKYILYSYKNNKYYKCNKCGTLTVYNVNGVCPKKECDGKLEECNPDIILKDNYYRKEYKTKKIEPMVIKEHTAQLNKKMAKMYQQEFKNGNINILSCSTTFEMGVDIGDLETVFMRNVPPSPANYVQRAGRAGRRKDSSAFIMTFCNNSSHDYTYFENPMKMIDGIIEPPHFQVTNEKIIIRHIIAAALGSFFRKYPEYFKNTGTLIFGGGLDSFKKYVLSNPQDLNEYINKKLLDSSIYNKFNNFKWANIIVNNDNLIDRFIEDIRMIVNDFYAGMEEAKTKNEFKKADYFKNQIDKIYAEPIIDNLSKYGVIPKYGFPVDVVELQIFNNGLKNKNYDLNRDLSIAISEYAPDSEIIVDKEKYTSRYIFLPKRGELRRYYYFTCINCDRVNIVDVPSSKEICQYCGKENETLQLPFFVEPIYGFKTGENKLNGRKKPKKTYASDRIYLGNGDLIDYTCKVNEIVKIETSTDDKLLVINSNPFFMCKTCGYTEINKLNSNINQIKCVHNNYRGYKCIDTELHKIALGHMFKTDVAKIIVNDFQDLKVAVSTLYALLEGISIAFNIERRDIDGLIIRNENLDYNLIIYDNVPGGAGHVKRLKDDITLKAALRAAYQKVNQNCCEENTSCYNCLRNYYNQKYHKILSRMSAKEGIKYILNEKYD